MKTIHLALSANGGAGIAARRSVEALSEMGIDAQLWTADGSAFGPALRKPRSTWWRIWIDRAPIRLYRRKNFFTSWSNNWQPSRLAAIINRAKPDIVNLHWVGGGFLSLREIQQFHAPIVWTMHDAWPFTGGCHYPENCEKFATGCGKCPQLGSNMRHDLSWFNLRAKRRGLREVMAFVSPSVWLAGLATASGLVESDRLHVVPYGLDLTKFLPGDQTDSRRALGLPKAAVVLVAGAHDLTERRKGCYLLREAVGRIVAGSRDRFVFVLFGANGDEVRQDWPCEVRWLGTLNGEREVARVCSAADVLLLPSLQDNFPNLALEAQACGCPVVGFNTGGLREIIEPTQTGGLAQETTAASLAEAVQTWLSTVRDRAEISVRTRARFERKFAFALHGQRMAALYTSVLQKRARQ